MKNLIRLKFDGEDGGDTQNPPTDDKDDDLDRNSQEIINKSDKI